MHRRSNQQLLSGICYGRDISLVLEHSWREIGYVASPFHCDYHQREVIIIIINRIITLYGEATVHLPCLVLITADSGSEISKQASSQEVWLRRKSQRQWEVAEKGSGIPLIFSVSVSFFPGSMKVWLTVFIEESSHTAEMCSNASTFI